MAVNTLRNFYQVLEDTFVGMCLSAFASGRRKVLHAPRFLFFDLGARHMLAGLPATESLLSMDAGRIFEQWVTTELYYRCLHRGRGFGLSTGRRCVPSAVGRRRGQHRVGSR